MDYKRPIRANSFQVMKIFAILITVMFQKGIHMSKLIKLYSVLYVNYTTIKL